MRKLSVDLPIREWDDVEQGWWASIRVRGDDLFIVAETHFDEAP